MRKIPQALLLALAVFGPASLSPLAAQQRAPVADVALVSDGTAPRTMEMRQALAKATADASAVLTAVQNDPGLAAALANNPAEGAAMLRARGVTRAETILVEPAGDQRTITITIIIGSIKITIIIRL
ncbi:MAG: hypothetical protein ACKOXK_07710 [Chakrabartia sp.]